MHAHILFVRDNAYEAGVTVVLTQCGLTMKTHKHPWKSENVTAVKEACRAWGMAGEVYPTGTPYYVLIPADAEHFSAYID